MGAIHSPCSATEGGTKQFVVLCGEVARVRVSCEGVLHLSMLLRPLVLICSFYRIPKNTDEPRRKLLNGKCRKMFNLFNEICLILDVGIQPHKVTLCAAPFWTQGLSQGGVIWETLSQPHFPISLIARLQDFQPIWELFGKWRARQLFRGRPGGTECDLSKILEAEDTT